MLCELVFIPCHVKPSMRFSHIYFLDSTRFRGISTIPDRDTNYDESQNKILNSLTLTYHLPDIQIVPLLTKILHTMRSPSPTPPIMVISPKDNPGWVCVYPASELRTTDRKRKLRIEIIPTVPRKIPKMRYSGLE